MIKLVVKRTVRSDGQKGYMVKDVELFPKERLPKLYLSTYPHCYYGSYLGEIIINPSVDEPFITVRKNDFITVDELENILAYLRVCGNNLREVNKKLAKMQEEWKGEEIYTI